MLNFRKSIIWLSLIFALLLQVMESFGREQKTGPIKLKVLYTPFLSQAPLFIAEAEGYFADQELQINFIRMGRSTAAIPALVQGDLDILAGDLNIGLLNAMARKARIRFVAEKGHINPIGCVSQFGFLVRRDLVEGGRLNSPAQLKGLRIAVSRASPSEYFVEKLLNPVGLTIDDVTLVDMLTSTYPDALEKKTIDAACASEPWITRAIESGHTVLWRSSQQVIPNFQRAFIVYGPNLIDQTPELGRRFMIAYLKAVKQYNQGKTERNLQIVSKYTELDQEFLRRACWPSFHNDGKINIEGLLDFQTWALKKGLLDKMVSPNQFWEPSYIEYANKVLNKLTK